MNADTADRSCRYLLTGTLLKKVYPLENKMTQNDLIIALYIIQELTYSKDNKGDNRAKLVAIRELSKHVLSLNSGR